MIHLGLLEYNWSGGGPNLQWYFNLLILPNDKMLVKLGLEDGERQFHLLEQLRKKQCYDINSEWAIPICQTVMFYLAKSPISVK